MESLNHDLDPNQHLPSNDLKDVLAHKSINAFTSLLFPLKTLARKSLNTLAPPCA